MVRKTQAFLIGFLLMCLTAMIAFVAGWRASQAFTQEALSGVIRAEDFRRPGQGDANSPERPSQFALFWDVWDLVDEEFYHKEPLDHKQMTYGAIKGMLQSLGDEYTSFQEPRVAQRTREHMRGSFEGIGILMRINDGELIVARPLRKSPALEAGLQDNDVIVGIDGEDVAPMIEDIDESEALDALSDKIRGPKGSTVVLTIRRPPNPTTFDVEIERNVVPLISVNHHMFDETIAYIQITEFKESTPDEFDEAVRELLPQNPEGLVLDLRNNPGGVLESSQKILGRFYDGVALYEENSKGEFKEFKTIAGPEDAHISGVPMVVLVNNHSASAAEIVAGALAERYPDTTLMGENTFGKGSVQNVHRLRDNSSARITIAHWFTPDKHEIHEIGIIPDYIVLPENDVQYMMPCIGDTLPPEGQEGCNDAQLSWAVRFLSMQEPPPPTPSPTSPA
jgi:carboxyl-terminal processing protease